LSEGQLAQWRGRNLGVVFQFFQLLPMLSLLENIMLPMDFCNMYSPRQRKERAMELLKQMELEEHANKLPTAISGGQQQRVAMARALANDPPLLVADEPTGNLDSHTAETIFKMFEDYINQGKTILMVTHDSSLARRASRTLLIADGEIVNEYIARAFPLLSHQQMLMATHKITSLVYKPGATIIQQGIVGEKFFIITKGQVEIVLKRSGGSDVVVARYGPSQYFGEVELMFGGGRNAASARAAPDMAVEVVALNLETFTELMYESPETRAAMAEIVDARMAENIQTRRGK
jgi:ABC-type lipoprotein export system ATPase subunit